MPCNKRVALSVPDAHSEVTLVNIVSLELLVSITVKYLVHDMRKIDGERDRRDRSIC